MFLDIEDQAIRNVNGNNENLLKIWKTKNNRQKHWNVLKINE